MKGEFYLMQIKIMKLNGKKVLDAKGELNYTYTQCCSDEIISLSESQLLVWLFGGQEELAKVSQQFSELKGQRTMSKSKSEVARLTASMQELQFTDKIVQIEIKNKQAVPLIREGFKLNNYKYKYLLSKGSQIITFAREDVYDDLHKRINNGRDMSVKFIPAKMNAYLSLTSTSSKWIPQPRKVAVVSDVVNKFTMPYLYVGEEGIEEKCDETTKEATDGAGMISPALMAEWSKHLGYGDNKISSGMSIRNSFVKGMVFPIDFHKYFEDRNVEYITDVWGNQVRVADVDMIITSSMHKGWKCYSSMEHYEQCCEANDYQYRVCKESHGVTWGKANYQMSIDLDISDEQIERLIQPSIDWIESLLTDWRSASLYLNGQTQSTTSSNKFDSLSDLIQLDHKFVEDKNIHQIIRSNLNGFRQELRRGGFLVDSSYQIIAPDVYQLCEVLAGIKNSKGLLTVGEVYSKHHADMGKQEAVLFRAPQINRYNNARVSLADSEELREFYKYCDEVVVLNNHDLICETLAGCDFDGDTCMVMTNDAWLELCPKLLSLRASNLSDSAVKAECHDEQLIQGAELGCNNEYQIGSCINKYTNMCSLRASFPKDSKEYQQLDRRIIDGIRISQSWIDAKKLGVAYDMPRHYYSTKACDELDQTLYDIEFEKRICANKKPMFNANDRELKRLKGIMNKLNLITLCNLGVSAEEFLVKDVNSMTEEEQQLLQQVYNESPILLNDDSTQTRIGQIADRMIKEMMDRVTIPRISHMDLLAPNVEISKKEIEQTKKAYKAYLVRNNKINSTIAYDKEQYKNWRIEQISQSKLDFKVELLELFSGNTDKIIKALLTALNESTSSIMFELFGEEICNSYIERNNITEIEVVVPCNKEECEFNYQGKQFKVMAKELN